MPNVTKLFADERGLQRLALSIVQLAQTEYAVEVGLGDEELALATIQGFAPLARIGTVECPLETLKARVIERKSTTTKRDLSLLAREVEEYLISNTIHTFGKSNCQSCDNQYDCGPLQELVASDDLRFNVYHSQAATLCTGYTPNRSAYDDVSGKLPVMLQKIRSYGVPVNVNATMKTTTTITRRWLNELERAGQSLPAKN